MGIKFARFPLLFALLSGLYAIQLGKADVSIRMTSGPVILEAKEGESSLWFVEFDPTRCQVVAYSEGTTHPGDQVKEHLPPRKCADLISLTQSFQVAQNSSKAQLTRRFASLGDEPNYVLGLKGSGAMPVRLVPPELCSIQDSGDLKCKKYKLTAAQSLLWAFRGWAHHLGVAQDQ